MTAAAKVVLKELTVNHLLDHVKEVGAYLKGELLKLQKEFDCIKEVRGFGMMLGMELTLPALEVEKKCMDKGMLVVGAGEKVVRFVPPLIIEKAHVDEAIAILKSVLSEM